MGRMKLAALLAVLSIFFAGSVIAQQMPNPYGSNINLESAKKVAAAAAQEAVNIKVNAVIAVVDTGGHLVYLERFDVVQWGSIEVAMHKAKSSAGFKRPTKAFESLIADGKTMYLTLDGIIALEGGVPIIQDGKIIGAVGVSGGTSAQDGQIAQAGAGVIK